MVLAITEAAVLSPLALPYAVTYPYLSTPFVTLLPAPALVQLKHHTPEHTEQEKKEEEKKEEADKQQQQQLPVVYKLNPYRYESSVFPI